MSFFQKGWIFFNNAFQGLIVKRIQKFFRRFYEGQHQLTSTTELNRYPEIFDEAKRYAGSFGDARLKILSYGCSTGEECFTLKSYFPSGQIIGADINQSNLKKASSKNTFSDITFILSTSENLKKDGKYHLIFCMSVLCRWDDTAFVTNCERIYPFRKFEETVVELSELLVPGGYFVIYNSNFRLEDTVLREHFESKSTPTVPDSGFVYKFDSSNNRLNENHKHCIYQKKLG